MTEHKWTSKEIVTSVRKHYGAERDNIGPEWASLAEFSLRPGGGWQRADLYIVRAWRGMPKGHERILIEVKVSRSDFLREMSKPYKMSELSSVSHRSYFATPEGVIKDTDDLGDVGHLLITVHGVKVARRCKRNDNPDPIPEGSFVEAFRRASRAEARERMVSDDPVSEVLSLKKEVERLKRSEQTLRDSQYRDTSALQSWTHILTDVGGVPCLCGAQLKKQSKKDIREARYYGAVQHADGSVCPNGYAQADIFTLIEMITKQQVVLIPTKDL